jgi:hypothetical protein
MKLRNERCDDEKYDIDITMVGKASDIKRAFKEAIRACKQTTWIATICVKGEKALDPKENPEREEILKEVVKKIVNEQWSNIDAIVFPGGFFRLNQYVEQSFQDRVSVLESYSFHNTCMQGCKDLSNSSPRVFIIAGVDTIEQRDQLCVAWTSKGIAGIGRKVFPISEEDPNNLVYKNDFSTDYRVIRLPSGKTAVLCACYDMFGCSETTENPTARTDYIRHIGEGSITHEYRDSNFEEIRKECVNNFQDLLKRHQVKIGIVAIHLFDKPGQDVYWRRHGIATCSATLQGLGIGAAHFKERLPDFKSSTLASAGVPREYLYLKPKTRRQDRSFLLEPIDYFSVDDKALVRLFGWTHT